MNRLITFICFISLFQFSYAQDKDYQQFYPIGESPSIRYMTPLNNKERPVLDIQPIVRFNIVNTIKKGLVNPGHKHMEAWYLAYLPQLRTYDDKISSSWSVRMPSYKILIGTQHLFRLSPEISNEQEFLGVAVESGHFSNGQNGCAFLEGERSRSADCFRAYENIDSKTNLSDILNRVNGKFSTNMSRVMVNYRSYLVSDNLFPDQLYSFQLGYTRFHNNIFGLLNYGGFTQRKDAQIYGLNRFDFKFEYQKTFAPNDLRRFSIRENVNYIQGAQASVNPWRFETMFVVYPFSKVRALGIFASYVLGHDDYNIRFIDNTKGAGSIGIRWSQFPALQLLSPRKKKQN